MIKLLTCLACCIAVGVAALELRQQQLELKHQAAALEGQIERQQARLWSQQLQIAVYTVPTSIKETVGTDLPLVPESKLPLKAGDWIDMESDQAQ
jgi:hypothetical protein